MRTPEVATSQTGRGVLLNSVTEKQWLSQVIAWARRADWLVYHTHNSLGSAGGFPDCVFVRPRTGEVVYAELKTERGKVSPVQQSWLDALAACNQRTFVWRPSDEATVKRALGLTGGLSESLIIRALKADQTRE